MRTGCLQKFDIGCSQIAVICTTKVLLQLRGDIDAHHTNCRYAVEVRRIGISAFRHRLLRISDYELVARYKCHTFLFIRARADRNESRIRVGERKTIT